ncbi:MAG: hypothetical protein IKH06_01315 [Clostridiales bacterium]|nr:hypothetical protein [Clostridiales bacterium]
MKKLIATLLCLTMAMSLASCSRKAPEQTSEKNEPGVYETEVPLTEPTQPAETTSNLAADFVKCKTEKIAFGEEDDYGYKDEAALYVPELLIKSSYADSVNKEISDAYEKIKNDLNKNDKADYSGTSYIAYLTKEGILSLVFIVYDETAGYEYKVYNIDTKTGEKVENARIAQIAGVSDITKAAKDALQNFLNKAGVYKVENYKVVSEKGEMDGSGKADVEKSFSDEYINDKMQIGLTNEGKMFFVTKISESSGTAYSFEIYDCDGTYLDDEENPFWTGDKDRDDEDNKGKETTATIALNKADYLKDKVVKFKVKDEYNKKKKKWTYVTYEFHFPELLIKSSYADSINKAMDKLIKEYKKEFKENGDVYDGVEYIAYLTKEGVLSIILIVTSGNDQIDCRLYNIDVKTGEKVDNARIAQIAGVTSIRKTAMDALQTKYNNEKHYKIKYYKVVKKKGKKKNEIDKDVEKSFNEKHLNDKMKIGLTDQSKIFFISDYIGGNGDEFTAIYDANGKNLYYDKNPNLVRQKD